MIARNLISELLAQPPARPFVRLVVVRTAGSAPREAGTAMLVTQDTTIGTIGGGQLEFEAIAHAKRLLATEDAEPIDWLRDLRVWPLGPTLGQCCGGTVQLLFERYGPKERESLSTLATSTDVAHVSRAMLVHPIRSGDPPFAHLLASDTTPLRQFVPGSVEKKLSGLRTAEPALLQCANNGTGYFVEPMARSNVPLFIYGAGHVGQAIVRIASDLEFDIYWVDTHDNRFPEEPLRDIQRVIARDPSRIARAAPEGAFHVVLTYSHALDLAICQELLVKSTFGFLGLIGSQTKRSRFRRRLLESGISPGALERLTCPIGIGGLRGKEPATIAVSVVAQLIERQEHLRDAGGPTAEGEHGSSQRIPA